jgi:hypothetical protein
MQKLFGGELMGWAELLLVVAGDVDDDSIKFVGLFCCGHVGIGVCLNNIESMIFFGPFKVFPTVNYVSVDLDDGLAHSLKAVMQKLGDGAATASQMQYSAFVQFLLQNIDQGSDYNPTISIV